MSRILVKICGITSPEDARLAVDAGADAVGFVFFSMSPRQTTVERAAEIGRTLSTTVQRVGVFVDETPEAMARAADVVGLDLLQLHGNESPESLAGLARPVIKALRVGKGFAHDEALRFAATASGLLVDTRLPGETQLPGGTGVRLRAPVRDGVRYGLVRELDLEPVVSEAGHPEREHFAREVYRIP